ncbi:Hypothetical Protein FCC1311_028712 [Hondaea fermentalgiana]|uniref:Uncharacterized protein n=1 Tax=Hondaea fermentalgiana TaxID=2315210 RepID=A0A2R5G6M7_9STRA|nr:Hypothetical Protein FCC1311_028712 [Hondaea fermentalgiana]|eukprot:GBG26650.1 Hypothetical Protein FCC1311_028712 [Hondaea fermentalgiana]
MTAGLEAKIKTLLRQRDEVIEALRDASLTLAESGVDHTEYLDAFLHESPPRDEDAEEEAAAIAQRRAQLLEGIQEMGGDLDHVESLEENWPLKRSWLQVLLFKLRNVFVSRENRAIQRIVEDAMRDNFRATITKSWLLAWVRSNFPVQVVEIEQGEQDDITVEDSEGMPESPRQTQTSCTTPENAIRTDKPNAETGESTQIDEYDKKESHENASKELSDSLPVTDGSRDLSTEGQVSTTTDLRTVDWPLWKLWPLRFKIHALAYLREHRNWLWKTVAPDEPLRKASFRVKLGSYARVNTTDALLFKLHTIEDGGPELLREVGARAVAPKPLACVSVDIRMPRDPVRPPSARSGSYDDSDEEGEEKKGKEPIPQPLEALELRDVLREAVDIVLDPELQQVPGYIVTKVGFTDKDKGALRITSFFSTDMEDNFWVQRLSGTLRIWPGLGLLQNWILQKEISLAGVDAQLTCEYRATRDEILTGSEISLRFPGLHGVVNPLARFYRSCMESTATKASRADAVCGILLEAFAAGSIEDLICVRACAGPHAIVLENES